MRAAYADPPYPGMAGFYVDHPDYAGEVDHGELVTRLCDEYDAWALHTASTTLQEVLHLCPEDVRIAAWVKTFASFKPGVNPAYAWEPVIFRGGRNDSSKRGATLTDWISCPITLRKGLTGAKPPEVVRWVFRLLGLGPDDTLEDLFPGTGVVSQTWERFRSTPSLTEPAQPHGAQLDLDPPPGLTSGAAHREGPSQVVSSCAP